LERAALGLIGLLLVATLGLLSPTIWRLASPPPPSPSPPPAATPAPQGVLLADELDQALQAVVTIVVLNDAGLTFGTAVAVDSKGDLLTSAQLLGTARAARVIDNTGGMHAVTVIGIDPARGIALVRSAAVSVVPLALGSTGALKLDDPVAVLASPKNGSLTSNVPGVVVVTATSSAIGGVTVTPLFQLHADLQTGNAGSPVVGYGAKLLGIVLPGGRLPANNPMIATAESAQEDLQRWHGVPGTALPLADLPPDLLLRGADEPAPSASGTVGASVSGIQPAQAKSGQDTTIVIQGSGFVAGAQATVRFVPLSGGAGAFLARNVSVSSETAIAATIPAGQRVQDYAVSVTNGDGSPVGGSVAFTIIP
jgi:Trypsin-like peptidase domain/IPT/TIG domain